jgi:hypothetical protein
VIGNVPFADMRLHDPRHNPSRLSLHNHFIVKALSLVREGGLVAVLTSHYTMDAQNPAARREIHRLAGLLGAVRLPTGAHRRTAGTDARTDLLILWRRDPDGDPRPRRVGDDRRVVTVFLCHMCAYVREILSGRLPGSFREPDARRFAQGALIPG